MATERRVATISRHLTSASDVYLSAKVDLRNFAAEDVYRFLTRDNVELRAKMLDFLKVVLAPYTRSMPSLYLKGIPTALLSGINKYNIRGVHLGAPSLVTLLLQRSRSFYVLLCCCLQQMVRARNLCT